MLTVIGNAELHSFTNALWPYLLKLHFTVEAKMDSLMLLNFRQWMFKNIQNIFLAHDSRVLLLYVTF